MEKLKKITSNLLNYIRTSPKDQSKTPEGLCPNCWGREEYGGNFYERVKNHGLDVNSDNHEVGWINDYVEKHLTPIVLFEEDDKHYCSLCKVSYHIKK